ncbi:cytidine deaminase [Clostridium sp. DL1XJH146]
MEYSKLMQEALKYRERAYVPYSNFKVGAAVLTSKGNIYGGCNIENASYGATCCAERTAIFKAISEGEERLQAIAVVGDLKQLSYPCGICRQVIREFGDRDIDVIVFTSLDNYKIYKLKELLPYDFTKEDLDSKEELCSNQDL